MSNVIAVEKTENKKTGPMSATYVSQETCPVECPLRGSGCYAETGRVGLITNRLNAASKSARVSQARIAREESEAIRQLTGARVLRVHVVGDCRTNMSADTVASAMEAHTAKHGQPSYAYTHAWRAVARESWRTTSVLASCESADDIRDARKRGYGTVIVVDFFQSDKAYKHNGERVVPCPAQTRGKTCVECRLCFDGDALRDRQTSIAFAAHGVQAKRVRTKVS